MLAERDSRLARGLTLIETLAAIGLLSITAVIICRGLMNQTEDAKATSIMSALIDMDKRARVLAAVGSEPQIVWDPDASRIGLRAEDSDREIAVVYIPAGWDFQWTDDLGRELRALAYSPAGRCRDFQMSLRGSLGEQSIKISGDTGWVQQ